MNSKNIYTENEWNWMRILFGVFWFLYIPIILFSYDQVPEPTGIGLILNLNFLSIEIVKMLVVVIALIFTVFYVKGIRMLMATASMAVIGIFVHTYLDSQGSYHHTELMQLALLGQFVAYFGAYYKGRSFKDKAVFNDAIINSKQLIMATYLVSGIAKLSTSGLGWVDDSPNISVQILKSFQELHYSFDFSWLEIHGKRMSEFVIGYPLLVKGMFACALMFELLGFFVTPFKKASVWVGLWFLVFHLCIFCMLGVFFIHFFLVLLIFMVNIGGFFPGIKSFNSVKN